MDFALSETQEMLKSTARDFVDRECPKDTLRQIDDSDTGFSPDLWRKMAEMGWTSLLLPERYGGSEGSLLDMAVIYEQMGRKLLPSPHFSSCVLSALTILEVGSDAQKQQLLPSIGSGERIVAMAITEPDYGWDADNINLAVSRRNANYVLNGTKLFVHDALVADQVIVLARTARGANPAEGLTMFLVDSSANGVSRNALTGFLGEKLCEVVLENVEVSPDNVLGPVGGAWQTLNNVLLKAVPILSAFKVGGMQEVYELTTEYSRSRIQFGVPIGTFQRVQDHIIDIVNAMDAAKWTTYEALWKLDTGKPGVAEAVALCKVLASEGFQQSCNWSHEVHAGVGVTREYGLYFYTKKSRSLYHYLGSPTTHRKKIADAIDL